MFMCSLCKMDPADLNRLRTRQGAVEIDDFYKEVDYTPRKKKKPQRAPRGKFKKNRCPGNDNGPHVYVWVNQHPDPFALVTFSEKAFKDYFGFHKFEYAYCAGCMKYKGYRHSERYEKIKQRKWDKKDDLPTGEPVPRYRFRSGLISYRIFVWERYDEGFAKIYNDYMIEKGYPHYLWWR